MSDNDPAGDLAADWAAAAATDGTGAKALSQNEIDSLLGFDDDGNSAGSSGIQAIINSALVSYERLPMLEVVYDRLVRMLTTSLRNFTSDNVEVTLDSITSTRFGDYLNSVPLPAMLCVFKAKRGLVSSRSKTKVTLASGSKASVMSCSTTEVSRSTSCRSIVV